MEKTNVKNMVVAFLDLLGFSQLLDLSTEVALDNINSFNNVIKTRALDNITHSIEEYKEQYPNDEHFLKFVKKSAVYSFEYMISFSDSLILGSHDLDLFVDQLANFIATLYINYSEPFSKKFKNLFDIDSNKIVSYEDGKLRNHKAFPILFRGGLSFGTDVNFFKENCIQGGKYCYDGYNVFGKTYLNAVRLEHKGKGPRLFCDKSIADNLVNRSLLRVVDKDENIYEIVWTIEACEATGCSSNKWFNVQECICNKLLPAAINFVCFYSSDSEFSEVLPQYKELLKLVCRGIVRYADVNCGKSQEALQLINDKLSNSGMDGYSNEELLEGFI